MYTRNWPSLAVSLLSVCSLMGCLQSRTPSVERERRYTSAGRMSEQDAIRLTAQLKPGMSFKEVAKIIPLTTNDLIAISHGGREYGVAVHGYAIVVGFEHTRDDEHPLGKTQVDDCHLMRPAALSKDGKLISIGGRLPNESEVPP